MISSISKQSRCIIQLSKRHIRGIRCFSTDDLQINQGGKLKYVPKVAKGMRDFGPEQMAIREKVFADIKTVFANHMAGQLDTPIMELAETLTGKYGEEGSKLIYNLADQGGELLSLRYDLTVPLARYISMHRLYNFKRFQIGKVYRREQSNISKARYREFYQCDFDIIGKSQSMLQEAEILKIIFEVFEKLHIDVDLKISHRLLLDGLLEISSCPVAKRHTVSSSIDKLDKEDWNIIREEIVQKGISAETCDLIGEFVKFKGPPHQVLEKLTNTNISSNNSAMTAIEDIEKLIELTDILGITHKISLDLSLARGLDYYTGLIYEAVLTEKGQSLGSIAGGGRYDDLISKLSDNKIKTPAIGVSFGVERIFSVLEDRLKSQKILFPKRSVLIVQAGNSSKYKLLHERLKICNLLWNNNIPCETSYKEKTDTKTQIINANESGIGFIIFIGEQELDNELIRIKNLKNHQETQINSESLIDYINNTF